MQLSAYGIRDPSLIAELSGEKQKRKLENLSRDCI